MILFPGFHRVPFLLVFGGALLLVSSARANLGGASPGYTLAPSNSVGFAEGNCSACHFPNAGQAGSISLNLPPAYKAGTTYSVTATVTSSGGTRFGFQATSLNAAGTQSGNLQNVSSSTQLKTNGLGNRQYIGHTSNSVFSGSWTFNWTAPNPANGTVSFYMSGLRANNDTNTTSDTTYNITNTVIVGVSPTISAQPTNKTVLAGSNVLFVVSASGTPSPGYQWRFNGTNIANATLSSYTRSNAQTNDAGSYTVAVTNIIGSITSSVALLTVNVAPAISGQPQSLTVTQGNNATFNVTAGGTPSPGYQWRFNGINLANATSSSYTRNTAQTNDAGSYAVVVTNVAGSVTSSIATLTVNFSPFIMTQPFSQTVSPSSNVTLSVAASGSPSPNYQWRTNGINFTSRTNSSLTVTNFQAANEVGYDVVVTNSLGSVTSSTALLYLNSPPRFTNVLRQSFQPNSNNFSVVLLGAANSNYVIDAATLLTNWTPVITNSSTNGIITFGETNVVSRGNRLFRARRQ